MTDSAPRSSTDGETPTERPKWRFSGRRGTPVHLRERTPATLPTEIRETVSQLAREKAGEASAAASKDGAPVRSAGSPELKLGGTERATPPVAGAPMPVERRTRGAEAESPVTMSSPESVPAAPAFDPSTILEPVSDLRNEVAQLRSQLASRDEAPVQPAPAPAPAFDSSVILEPVTDLRDQVAELREQLATLRVPEADALATASAAAAADQAALESPAPAATDDAAEHAVSSPELELVSGDASAEQEVPAADVEAETEAEVDAAPEPVAVEPLTPEPLASTEPVAESEPVVEHERAVEPDTELPEVVALPEPTATTEPDTEPVAVVETAADVEPDTEPVAETEASVESPAPAPRPKLTDAERKRRAKARAKARAKEQRDRKSGKTSSAPARSASSDSGSASSTNKRRRLFSRGRDVDAAVEPTAIEPTTVEPSTPVEPLEPVAPVASHTEPIDLVAELPAPTGLDITDPVQELQLPTAAEPTDSNEPTVADLEPSLPDDLPDLAGAWSEMTSTPEPVLDQAPEQPAEDVDLAERLTQVASTDDDVIPPTWDGPEPRLGFDSAQDAAWDLGKLPILLTGETATELDLPAAAAEPTAEPVAEPATEPALEDWAPSFHDVPSLPVSWEPALEQPSATTEPTPLPTPAPVDEERSALDRIAQLAAELAEPRLAPGQDEAPAPVGFAHLKPMRWDASEGVPAEPLTGDLPPAPLPDAIARLAAPLYAPGEEPRPARAHAREVNGDATVSHGTASEHVLAARARTARRRAELDLVVAGLTCLAHPEHD